MFYLSGNPYFDPKMPIEMWRYNLPHWEQEGKIHYLTFRLHDSLPQHVIDNYKWQKDIFVKSHPRPWTDEIKREYSKLVSNPIENFLDAGYGECVLKDASVRQFLIDAIDFYDGDRFGVVGYVIILNHVHILAMPLNGYKLKETIVSIQKFSATQINRHLGRKGQLWQTEPFDSIVRSALQYNKCVEYIRHNPDHLPPGNYYFGGLEFRW